MPREYYLPERRLVSQEDGSIIASSRIPRSRFRGTKSVKTTFDAGYLIPFHVDEVYPGDHMRYNVTAYVRMATPLFPIYDSQRVDTHWFYVPMRVVWDNFERFQGAQLAPTDSINFTIPQVVSAAGGFPAHSIYDQMGLPVVGQIAGGEDITINVLPFRCYNLIYNEWFRDQNSISNAVSATNDGPDTESWYVLKRRAKSHDYFTTCLPAPQKFTPPTIPAAGLAPVLGLGVLSQTFGDAANPVYEAGGTSQNYTIAKLVDAGVANRDLYIEGTAALGGYPAVYADLSQATGIDVNTFRLAFLTQQILERDQRGGTRYIERVKAMFDVTVPDYRVQRPEYIGGGQTPLVVAPVAQTAPTAGQPVGFLGGTGTAAGGHTASYAAVEHGYIIGLISIKTELSYQQGIARMWRRLTRADLYDPMLAGLGEQAVLREEIYATGNAANDATVFGYQERWHELRTMYSEVRGLFRSTTASTIDPWHLAQEFTAAPTLGQTFIEDTPPMDRVLAAGELAVNQQYLADILITRDAIRPLPTFGTPVMLGGRF